MRKYIKRKLVEILNTMQESTELIFAAVQNHNMQMLGELLADQQEAAMAIGNEVEGSEGEGTKVVCLLEVYCEFLWEISQETEQAEMEVRVKQLPKMIEQIEWEMQNLPEQMDVVFLPYKASMWDCMESVWEAACVDENCYPIVMPIPYFDLERGRVTTIHYEGKQFPEYVPIVAYNSLSLEELHPDMIFIHNPFDGNNLITSVLPQFYSNKLKMLTRKLIYIPYYVTGNAVYFTHRYLAAYENIDFIVTQCENMINSYSETIPREKFLPFGSPVADRIIKLERKKNAIPSEWKSMLPNGQDFGENRVVMLNTSISLLLKEQHRFLNKLEYIFDVVKKMEKILLVWRPHPLLHATAVNMGTEYVERLEELEQRFLKEKLGVLDKTSDVGVAVALCDAYLGEMNSSLIHMFGIARKPRFYINLWLPKQQFVETQIEYEITSYCKDDISEYFLLDELGWIVSKNVKTGKVIPFLRIPDREYMEGRAYLAMEIKDGHMWLYPDNALGILMYDMKSGRMRKMFENFAPIKLEKNETVPKTLSLAVDSECIRIITAERFAKGNNIHEWQEGEENGLEDYFRFLIMSDKAGLLGDFGSYPMWLSSLDGSSGRKVLEAVIESLCEEL